MRVPKRGKKARSSPRQQLKTKQKTNPNTPSISQVSDRSGIGEYAAMLNSAPANQQWLNQQLLVQLQQRYGNHYVNQVLQLAMGQNERTQTSLSQAVSTLTKDEAGFYEVFLEQYDRVLEQAIETAEREATTFVDIGHFIGIDAGEETMIVELYECEENGTQMKPKARSQISDRIARLPA